MAEKTRRSAPSRQPVRRVVATGTETEPEPTHLVKVLGLGAELRVFGKRDQKIAMIAAAQRGRVSSRQLHAAGISKGVISRLVRRGVLLPLLPGVFAAGHRAPTEFGPETSALLAVGREAVLSHHTAARLWGLRASAADDAEVHLLVRGGSGSSPAGIRLHRTRSLERRDVRIRHRLPVTSPARTLADVAGGLTDRQLEFAFDQAVTSGIVRPAEIVEVASRMPGRRGRARLRALAEAERAPSLTRSEAEERFLALIRSAELPEPEINVRIHGYEVDFLWRAQRLVVEVDGYRYHSTRRAFEHDRRKGATLQAAGLGMMRITWRQLEREPFAVIARLAAAMA
jgi:very-short-patch-repair endonuclease